MATDPDLATEAAGPATTQAVLVQSTPTRTASSGTQQGSSRCLGRDDWDEMSCGSEREGLTSGSSQLSSAPTSQKMKASSDSEGVSREEDEGAAAKRTKSMDQHNENERKRRRGLRDSVLKLREVLQKKTRKPAVNCVLTAAYSEIQELKQLEEEQERTLNHLRQENFLLEYTLNRLKTESREELSPVRSVPVVSTSTGGDSGSHGQPELMAEPVQSQSPSSSSSPAEPGPSGRSRDPPPLLDTTRLFFPPILSPPILPSPLPLAPATLMRTGPQIPFPFPSTFPAMPHGYFYPRLPHYRPSFPPPLVYLPSNCPPVCIGSPALYPSSAPNYESPPLVGQQQQQHRAGESDTSSPEENWQRRHPPSSDKRHRNE